MLIYVMEDLEDGTRLISYSKEGFGSFVTSNYTEAQVKSNKLEFFVFDVSKQEVLDELHETKEKNSLARAVLEYKEEYEERYKREMLK